MFKHGLHMETSVEKFSILLWQARVGREIERYAREREQ
jgi:hypothetical protein